MTAWLWSMVNMCATRLGILSMQMRSYVLAEFATILGYVSTYLTIALAPANMRVVVY